MTVNEYMDNAVREIRTLYEAQGRRASGTYGRMLSTEVLERPDKVTARIYGADYAGFTEYGRAPGKFPPVSAILDWIRAKNIDVEGIKEESLAYLIARKIAREGTKPQEPILEKVLTKEWLSELGKMVLVSRVEEIRTILRSIQYGNN